MNTCSTASSLWKTTWKTLTNTLFTMLFHNPAILYALPAVLIPVIVHLFSFRRHRKIYFSNVRMLQAIQIETRRQSKLRHWLVLASRMLAIAALVLAFARPYLPDDDKIDLTGQNLVVSIFIDNSFSMANEGSRGMLFEQARIKAVEMVTAWPPTTRFRVLTNDFSYHGQQLLSQEQARQYIATLELSPAPRTLSQVLVRQREANQSNDHNLSFIFSDFQKSFCDINSIAPDSTTTTTLVPLLPTSTGNIVIDTVRFDSPALQAGQQLRLIISISNHHEEARENVPVRLIINGQQKSTVNITIGAGETIETTLPFLLTAPGFYQAVVETDDQPIAYDNRYFMAFNLTSTINVLHLTQGTPARWLATLFGSDSTINLQQQAIRELDYSVIPNQQLIVLDGPEQIEEGLLMALKDFTLQGGTLWINPPAEAEATGLNRLLATLGIDLLLPSDTTALRVDKINLQADLYRGVVEAVPQNANMPVVRHRFRIGNAIKKQSQTLLTLQNGDALLNYYPAEPGGIYLFASPLDETGGNFVRHDLLVPTLYNAAYLSVKPGNISYTVMKEATVRIPGTTAEGHLKISRTDGSEERIPLIRTLTRTTEVFTGADLTTAGFYQLTADGIVQNYLAFNYIRTESEPTYVEPEALQEALTAAGLSTIGVARNPELPATAIIAEATENQSLWKFFIVAVLIFLAIEVILLRLPDRLFRGKKGEKLSTTAPI